MKEGSVVNSEITKEVGEHLDLDLEKTLRIQTDCISEVRNLQAQQPREENLLVRTYTRS
jgi:O-phosphoseryl-tRNA(Cys) synthetase